MSESSLYLTSQSTSSDFCGTRAKMFGFFLNLFKCQYKGLWWKELNMKVTTNILMFPIMKTAFWRAGLFLTTYRVHGTCCLCCWSSVCTHHRCPYVRSCMSNIDALVSAVLCQSSDQYLRVTPVNTNTNTCLNIHRERLDQDDVLYHMRCYTTRNVTF